MPTDPTNWLATLKVGDTVTVTHISHTSAYPRYPDLTPQYALVTKVSRGQVTVLSQNFSRTSDLGPAGHALTGAVATITPAEALGATELQARLNAALNILLPLDHPATRQLSEVMDRVPFWSMSQVVNPGLVMDLERAVVALQAFATDIQAVAAEIEDQLSVGEERLRSLMAAE